MHGLGFVFFDFLHIERWRRKTLATSDPTTWYGSGQLVWAQAFYLRDLVAEMGCPLFKPTENTRLRVLKLASLAEIFGFQDFAIEVCQSAGSTGLLDEEDVKLMVGLLIISEELEEVHGGDWHLRHVGTIKRVARSFVPAAYLQVLRQFFEAILMS